MLVLVKGEQHEPTCEDCDGPWSSHSWAGPGSRIHCPRVRCCEGDMMGGDLCRDCPRRRKP